MCQFLLSISWLYPLPTVAGMPCSPRCSQRYDGRLGPAVLQQQEEPAAQQQAQRQHTPMAVREPWCQGPAPPLLRQAQRMHCVPPAAGLGAAAPWQQPALQGVQHPPQLQPQDGHHPPQLELGVPPPPPKEQPQSSQAALQAQHGRPAQHNAAFWSTLRRIKTLVDSQQQAHAAQQEQGAASGGQQAQATQHEAPVQEAGQWRQQQLQRQHQQDQAALLGPQQPSSST